MTDTHADGTTDRTDAQGPFQTAEGLRIPPSNELISGTNLYEVVGVSRDAKPQHIETILRVRKQDFAPSEVDTNNSTSNTARRRSDQINLAAMILLDEGRRQIYDELAHNLRAQLVIADDEIQTVLNRIGAVCMSDEKGPRELIEEFGHPDADPTAWVERSHDSALTPEQSGLGANGTVNSPRSVNGTGDGEGTSHDTEAPGPTIETGTDVSWEERLPHDDSPFSPHSQTDQSSLPETSTDELESSDTKSDSASAPTDPDAPVENHDGPDSSGLTEGSSEQDGSGGAKSRTENHTHTPPATSDIARDSSSPEEESTPSVPSLAKPPGKLDTDPTARDGDEPAANNPSETGGSKEEEACEQESPSIDGFLENVHVRGFVARARNTLLASSGTGTRTRTRTRAGTGDSDSSTSPANSMEDHDDQPASVWSSPIPKPAPVEANLSRADGGGTEQGSLFAETADEGAEQDGTEEPITDQDQDQDQESSQRDPLPVISSSLTEPASESDGAVEKGSATDDSSLVSAVGTSAEEESPSRQGDAVDVDVDVAPAEAEIEPGKEKASIETTDPTGTETMPSGGEETHDTDTDTHVNRVTDVEELRERLRARTEPLGKLAEYNAQRDSEAQSGGEEERSAVPDLDGSETDKDDDEDVEPRDTDTNTNTDADRVTEIKEFRERLRARTEQLEDLTVSEVRRDGETRSEDRGVSGATPVSDDSETEQDGGAVSPSLGDSSALSDSQDSRDQWSREGGEKRSSADSSEVKAEGKNNDKDKDKYKSSESGAGLSSEMSRVAGSEEKSTDVTEPKSADEPVTVTQEIQESSPEDVRKALENIDPEPVTSADLSESTPESIRQALTDLTEDRESTTIVGPQENPQEDAHAQDPAGTAPPSSGGSALPENAEVRSSGTTQKAILSEEVDGRINIVGDDTESQRSGLPGDAVQVGPPVSPLDKPRIHSTASTSPVGSAETSSSSTGPTSEARAPLSEQANAGGESPTTEYDYSEAKAKTTATGTETATATGTGTGTPGQGDVGEGGPAAPSASTERTTDSGSGGEELIDSSDASTLAPASGMASTPGSLSQSLRSPTSVQYQNIDLSKSNTTTWLRRVLYGTILVSGLVGAQMVVEIFPSVASPGVGLGAAIAFAAVAALTVVRFTRLVTPGSWSNQAPTEYRTPLMLGGVSLMLAVVVAATAQAHPWTWAWTAMTDGPRVAGALWLVEGTMPPVFPVRAWMVNAVGAGIFGMGLFVGGWWLLTGVSYRMWYDRCLNGHSSQPPLWDGLFAIPVGVVVWATFSRVLSSLGVSAPPSLLTLPTTPSLPPRVLTTLGVSVEAGGTILTDATVVMGCIAIAGVLTIGYHLRRVIPLSSRRTQTQRQDPQVEPDGGVPSDLSVQYGTTEENGSDRR